MFTGQSPRPLRLIKLYACLLNNASANADKEMDKSVMGFLGISISQNMSSNETNCSLKAIPDTNAPVTSSASLLLPLRIWYALSTCSCFEPTRVAVRLLPGLICTRECDMVLQQGSRSDVEAFCLTRIKGTEEWRWPPAEPLHCDLVGAYGSS